MPRLSWTQYICERCWISKHTTVADDASGFYIQQPVRVKDPEPGICAYCGFPTIWGVFVRDDPNEVPYPREENE